MNYLFKKLTKTLKILNVISLWINGLLHVLNVTIL